VKKEEYEGQGERENVRRDRATDKRSDSDMRPKMGREEENEKRLRDKEKGRNREETGRQSYVRHQEGTGRK
jgi:hypothetical protein